MLKRSKAWRRANQQGTVLLTVVIMVMVLFTLTSICLDVIHHSTRMSSRNVQKTQAKLTAEKVLTEFIEGFKKGEMGSDSTITAEKAYNRLRSEYATGKGINNPTVIKVSMNDSTGGTQTDFDHQFGKTELHIYENAGATGFVVESICTYSTQTQTATCVFEGATVSPYVPSNTIESQRGKLIDEKQLSNGAKGSVWIEKGASDNGYKKLSRIGNEAHFYVEHNVRLDDEWTTKDVENHIDPNAIDSVTGDKVLKYKVPHFGFKQAPTVTVDGYFASQNSNNGIFTTVGKTDANMINPDYVGTEGTYDPNNLGNYDGYVKVDKKFLATSPKNFKFGDTNGDIDLYTHGLIVGAFPDVNIPGVHDFHAEAENVKTIYDGYLQSQPSETMEVYGNVYIYKGAEESTQDGSLFITRATLNVHGDLFVEGNIYLVSGFIKCNKLHCTGDVYAFENDPSTSNGFYTLPSFPTTHVSVTSSGIPLSNEAGTKANNWITASSIDNNIDTTIQRNKYPEDGFDPQTGNTSSTKASLNELYGECSANDMFISTMDDFTNVLTEKQKLGKGSAKDISKKYADAMQRGYVRNTSTGTLSDVIDYNGKPVVEFIGKTDDGDYYYEINASVKLDETQANNGSNGNVVIGYVINLVDEDIVIALPTGNIGARFRVNSTNRDASKAPFVYFMFYDPDKEKYDTYTKANGTTGMYEEDACLYFTGTDTTTKYTLSSGYKTVGVGKKDVDSTGSGMGGIFFGNADFHKNSGTLVGDLRTIDQSSGDIYTDPSKTDAEKLAALKTNFNYAGFANTSNMNNTIMYLIPNDVGFAFVTNTNTSAGFDAWSGGGSGAWYAQGLVYGVRSHIKINTQESGGASAGLFGQVKGYEVSFYGDNKGATMDCPLEDGSLLGFVKAANATASVVKLQYYLY